MLQIEKIIEAPSLSQIKAWKYNLELMPAQSPEVLVMETVLNSVDIHALRNSAAFLIQRHESLRTRFPMIEGEIKQVIMPYDLLTFDINYLDLSNDTNWINIVNSTRKNYFECLRDLQNGPLVKMSLFKNNLGQFYFLFMIHHIICDAWSLNIITDELNRFYKKFKNDQELIAEIPAFQLRDYTRKQNEYLFSRKENEIRFWNEKIGSIRGSLNVASIYTALGMDTVEIENKNINSMDALLRVLNKNKGASLTLNVIDNQYSLIKDLIRKYKVTTSSILYVSYFLLFHFLTGKEKILIASPIGDRLTAKSKKIIGSLVGSIYLFQEFNRDLKIADFIHIVNLNFIRACRRIIFDHDYLNLDGDPLRSNCDLYLNYTNEEINKGECKSMPGGPQANTEVYYALACVVSEYKDGLSFKWQYNTELFDEHIMNKIASLHRLILELIHRNEMGSCLDIIVKLKELKY